MNGLIKKYLPYAIVIFAVFLLVPLLFIPGSLLADFWPVLVYFILLTTAVVTSAVYCAKHGIDFLFALMAPIAFLFTMIFYAGGFKGTNLILLFVYLVAGIFGQFLGDLAFGDDRRKKEKQEKQEQEKLMLRAKRRDERERLRMEKESAEQTEAERYDYDDEAETTSDKSSINDDDFDYDKYMADIDRMLEEDRNRKTDF